MNKRSIAKYISIVCHPFVTIPVFLLIILFVREGVDNPRTLATMVIGGIFAPISLVTYIRVKKGKYTNLDVSDRRQRQRWFILTTALILIVTSLLWITGQDMLVSIAMTVSLFLMIVSQLVNTLIKASMHVAYHTYLGFVIFYLYPWVGTVFLFFLPSLAWSRVYLKRHSKAEVAAGLALGAVFGFIFLTWIYR